jgi:N-acetylmuramoyl-L-alanine amidase
VHNGIRETDLNMLVMEKLLHFIEADGFIRAYTTRNTDRHFDENLATDLLMRSHFSNAIGDLFISIHHNSVGSPGVHGLETYYRESPQDEFRVMPSRLLAEIMHRHLLGALGSHDREVRSANFSVLRNSNIPAVLLELGFMSNPAELARMNTPEFQWQAARAVYDALLEIFAIYTPR